jgi:N-succinyldiaminopimelate aminotransferase
MPLDEWQRLFELSDRHGFVIASDECYSEIYFRRSPAGRPGGRQGPGPRRFPQPGDVLQPVQALQRAGHALGLRGRRRRILKAFLLYRTYHGSAMSPTVQAASIAAWNDEAHVQDNRRCTARSSPRHAHAGRGAGREAARRRLLPVGRRARGRRHRLRLGLLAQYNVTVLPGSLLAREAHGVNPGAGRIRMALVAEIDECVEAAQRIVAYTRSL